MDKYESGRLCVIAGRSDLAFSFGARKFIDQKCVIVKRTKSGLIQVSLLIDPRKVMSFPQNNIDLLPDTESEKVL